MLAASTFWLPAEQRVSLAWNPNPEPDIAGYILYYGSASRTYPQSTNVGNVTTATVQGLLDGSTVYFAVTAVNTAGLESDYSSEVSATLPSAYDLWARTYFSSNILARPDLAATVWGAQADPDKDGRVNLTEFSLGLNPVRNEPTQGGLVATIVTNAGQRRLALTFPRRKGVTQLHYVPEVSSDRTNWWGTSDALRQTAVVTRDAEFELATYEDLTAIEPQQPRFMRLRVIKDEN